MKTAVIYTRSASVDGNIERQIAICRNFAKTKGIKIKKVYVDKGISGRNTNRESFKNMMQDYSKDKYDYIIVENFSRICRDFKGFKIIEQRFANKRIEILSTTETIYDRFLLSWSETVYQIYLEELTKRGIK